MSKDRIFYVCEHCGNLVEMVRNAGVPMICCGQKMTCLEPKTEDGGFEKHLPVVRWRETVFAWWLVKRAIP